MFNIKAIRDLWAHTDQISSRVHSLSQDIREGKEISTKEVELIKQNIINFESKIQDKLDIFHKEISDKYIKAIESIIQTTKETMLIDTLIKQVSEKDLNNLKRIIMQPIIEERIKEENKKKGQEIESNIQTRGELLLGEKRKLHDEYLKLQRESKDTKYIEGQLYILEQITQKESINAP